MIVLSFSPFYYNGKVAKLSIFMTRETHGHYLLGAHRVKTLSYATARKLHKKLANCTRNITRTGLDLEGKLLAFARKGFQT